MEKENLTEKEEQTIQEQEVKEQVAEEIDYKALAEQNQKLAEEYKDKWYRTTAEYENYRKRTQTERAQAYSNGQTDAVKKILAIGDNLERAITFNVDEKSKEGLELILKQYKDVAVNLGLTEIDPTGKPFDPNEAEAVMQAEAENGEESGTVKTTFLKGYKLGDKIIRYAQVVVIK